MYIIYIRFICILYTSGLYVYYIHQVYMYIRYIRFICILYTSGLYVYYASGFLTFRYNNGAVL